MRFIVLLALLFLVSCSSAKRRAIELSEKGHFEEAILEWEKALKDDPKDEEALEGLKKSQEMAINNRLVQLRNLRNSNEHARALDALKSLVELQAKWNYKLDVNSATFQGKETALLWNPFKNEVTARLKKGHALSAAALYLDFKDIFAFAPKGELDGERARIFSAGKKSCRAFKDSVQYPYLASFHNRYCEYFGVKKTSKIVYSDVYGHLKINYTLDGTTEESKYTLLTKMNSSFRETPWYLKSSSKEIPLTVSGKLVGKTRSQLVEQVQEYWDKETYTTHESIRKSCLKSDGSYEDCYEVQEVTKERDVRKEFEYTATKLSQDITLNFKSEFHLVKMIHTVEMDKDYHEELIVHDHYMPHIDLYPPKIKKLETPESIWEKFSQESAERFKDKLMKVWVAEYCKLPETMSFSSVAENVLRCRKSPEMKSSDFVNTWFQNNYGSSNAVAEKVLGDF